MLWGFAVAMLRAAAAGLRRGSPPVPANIMGPRGPPAAAGGGASLRAPALFLFLAIPLDEIRRPGRFAIGGQTLPHGKKHPCRCIFFVLVLDDRA